MNKKTVKINLRVQAIIEMSRYYLEEIRQTLAAYDQSRSLLLFPDGTSLSKLTEIDRQVLSKISYTPHEQKNQKIKIDGKKYSYYLSSNLKSGIQMISYFHLSRLLDPVNKLGFFTLIAGFILLGLAIYFIVLFYRSIMLQINRLVFYFKKVENGDFSTRIVEEPRNEFGYVFSQFNQMVQGGQMLLQSLSKEQKLRDISEFKQMQLQIDPHFLYNSLAYIVSVAANRDAVVDMSSHLAQYYRYRTRAREQTILKDELDFAQSYLEIMTMRKELVYSIDFSEEMMEVPILPLIIQPLVENAIEHGIEGREGAFQVYLLGERKNGSIKISIIDDGKGLYDDEIQSLLIYTNQKEIDEEGSVGLWNVNQRLINHYGQDSRLHFQSNDFGGLTVWFNIKEGMK